MGCIQSKPVTQHKFCDTWPQPPAADGIVECGCLGLQQNDGQPGTGIAAAIVNLDSQETSTKHAGLPLDAVLRRAPTGELAILDELQLRAALQHASQPVLVLTVPSQLPARPETDVSPEGLPDALLISTPEETSDGNAAEPTFKLSYIGEEAHLMLTTEQGFTALRCVLANDAALQSLGLEDEPAVLGFLARSFHADRGLVSLFQDAVKRLLAGHLTAAKHFVPGDFGRDRYFLSMRISPFAFRASTPSANSDAATAAGSCASSPSCCATAPSGCCCGCLVPGMLLELDVPYEGKELAARLQRDYLILSNIPSMVTIFDLSGNVLHQNRSSVAFMGYLVGAGLSRRATQQQYQQQLQAGNSSRSSGGPTAPWVFRQQHQ
ncbi:hypothetical protein Agub_g14419, partial [Astrephomene gubernaculifera]